MNKRFKTIFLWSALLLTVSAGVWCKFLAGEHYWEHVSHTLKQGLLFWGLASISIVGFVSLCINPKKWKSTTIQSRRTENNIFMKRILMGGMILWLAGTAWAQSDNASDSAQDVPQAQPPAAVAPAPAPPPGRGNGLVRALMEAKRRSLAATPPAAPSARQGAKSTSSQIQAKKTTPLPVAKKTTTLPEDNNRNQLIKNLPYQPAKPTPVPPLSSQPAQAAVSNSSRMTVCVMNGFESSGLSSEECRAKGGKEIVTAEVFKTATK
jgi:hypothetical protein